MAGCIAHEVIFKFSFYLSRIKNCFRKSLSSDLHQAILFNNIKNLYNNVVFLLYNLGVNIILFTLSRMFLLATKFFGSLWSHIRSRDSPHQFYATPNYCLQVCCGSYTPPTAHSNQFQLFHDSSR
jgi:hypothetical protein